MNPSEIHSVHKGQHWLCRLAERLGTNAERIITELDAWQWEPGEIALAIIDGTQPNGVTRDCVIHLRVWPIEKKVILDAAAGTKLNDFIRAAVLEKVAREL